METRTLPQSVTDRCTYVPIHIRTTVKLYAPPHFVCGNKNDNFPIFILFPFQYGDFLSFYFYCYFLLLPMLWSEISREPENKQEGEEALNRSPEYTGQKSNI